MKKKLNDAPGGNIDHFCHLQTIRFFSGAADDVHSLISPFRCAFRRIRYQRIALSPLADFRICNKKIKNAITEKRPFGFELPFIRRVDVAAFAHPAFLIFIVL